MASSSRPPAQSTIPLNKPILLPPLDAPPLKKGSAPPVVYALKLSNDVVQALMNCQDPTVHFNANGRGVFSLPHKHEVAFSVRPVTNTHNDTARAACYSRRGEVLRSVGPIVADMDVDPRLSKPSLSKKRTLDGAHTKRTEVNNSNDPTSTNKRARVTKPAAPPVSTTASSTAAKRARPRKPGLSVLSQPMPKLQSQPMSSMLKPGLTSKPRAKTPPRPSTSPHRLPAPVPKPPSNGHHASYPRNALRSAPALRHRSPASPNLSPSARAPATGSLQLQSAHPLPLSSAPRLLRSAPAPLRSQSPHHERASGGLGQSGLGNKSLGGAPALGSRAGSRMGNGGGVSPRGPEGISKHGMRSSLSALKQRRVSPGSIAALPQPRTRHGSGQQYSPVGARPSGADMSGNYGSPESPRVGVNARPISRDELRKDVLHILGAGERSMDDLKRRLNIEDGSEGSSMLDNIVWDVADRENGVLSLKEKLWGELSDTYGKYSAGERAEVRIRRSNRSSRRQSGDEGGATSGMTEKQLDDRLSEFEKEERGRKVGRVNSDGAERDMRRRFTKWYPVYRAMVWDMNNMRKTFASLEKEFRDSRGRGGRDGVVKRIQNSHDKFQSKKRRMDKCLPVMHSLLKDIKGALERASKEGS